MNKRTIQFSRLGKIGGWGNQLFQYCFARAFAEKSESVLEIPGGWLGRMVFKGVDHPPISRKLPSMWDGKLIFGMNNIDLIGACMDRMFYDIVRRDDIKRWFQFKDSVLSKVQVPVGPYVAVHYRRADYLDPKNIEAGFATVSDASYDKILENLGKNVGPIIKLGDGTRRDEDDVMLSDFIHMVKAPILVRCNSSFSLWAAFLGSGRVFSPVLDRRTGIVDVEFVEGNHPRTGRDLPEVAFR
jgi:hypothetical protein